jgi:hypothetical protein
MTADTPEATMPPDSPSSEAVDSTRSIPAAASTRSVLAAAAGFALLVAVALLAGTSAGTATAGDTPTVIYTAPENHTVDAGDSLEVDVYVASDGGVGDVGVESMTVVTDYDESILTVAEVDPASWLEGDEPTSVETEVETDNDAGEVTVEQWRDPPAGGTTGDERFATITFEVDDDVALENTTLRFGESDVRLTDEFSVPVFSNNATVTVEESGGFGVTSIAAGAALVGVAALVAIGVVAIGRRR